MVSTHLIIQGREDWRSLSKLNHVFFFQFCKLPFDKRVIVRVFRCGNKWSSVVHRGSKSLDVLLSKSWEIIKPKKRVFEFWNNFIWDVHLFHDLILGLSRTRFFLAELLELFFSIFFKIFSKFFGSSRNWHSCTMIRKREESIVSLESFVSYHELCFG